MEASRFHWENPQRGGWIFVAPIRNLKKRDEGSVFDERLTRVHYWLKIH